MKYPQLNNLHACEKSFFLLQKCMKSKALKPGKQLHSSLLASGADMEFNSLGSKIVGLYASCGDIKSAKLMFQRTQNPSVFAYNWMISSLAFSGSYENALGYFSLFQESRNVANEYTFSSVLKACVGLMDCKKGREVHCRICTMGLGLGLEVGNGLVDMYWKCGWVVYARLVFDRIVERDVASWTSMICGYFSVGEIEEAYGLFERMKLEGVEVNGFTWNAMIAGCAREGDCDGAFALFCRMVKEGFVLDVVTWNAMISGFVQSKRTIEAVKLFKDMMVAGIRPSHVTVTAVLPVCGLMDSVRRGKEIHGFIYRMELYMNVFVASALIDMYSKCGTVIDARNVFETIPIKNVASWNAMIGCYGKHGLVDSAIQLFERMTTEGMQPNPVTFTCVLSACSHGGFVDKGLEIFRSIRKCYDIEASQEHYSCVVDLLCRFGRMDETYDFVKEMPLAVTESIIGAFFNGCKLHNRRDLAKKIVNVLSEMETRRPGGFVTLSNICGAEEEWEEVEYVRKLMKEKGIHKRPGISLFETRDVSSRSELKSKGFTL
ncbi:hypothetical protein DCAR_0728227 [Daucus carota subsp. sativus]|uniref:Pentacotripeptide-repeat region of PRORP domain-containing protein n=1 Tax=Daucus carota subsp. sativus TaxID=79200 RepID=A0AAF1B6U3_DAUCS|nr:PREDICTED: pentatricopeptide repeat-containing protein At5g59600 [Daucus carota subsp. sativus]XP_017216046.1 PREDICTED: pentatricopeptide repeat-containing protein At5g59600 [Daucus carota subsp. sativus]WOH08779.1 hypothetical protein DCAR_0728227 [Daucus carota subsp. sativus]